MTSLTAAFGKIEGSENNVEQISKLFPKCRPRSDINLNSIIASGKENVSVDNATRKNDIMSFNGENDRIIEIAGGREIYSQSRIKAARKPKNNVHLVEDAEKKLQNKSPMKQGVWELRGRSNEAKKCKNSREYTETVFASEVWSVTHEKDAEDQSNNQTNPVNMAFPSEVVVFDDIGENIHIDEKHHDAEQINYTSSSIGFNLSDTDSDKVTKVIGSLPIAVYEGSPRRYGPRLLDTGGSHMQLPSAQSLLASPSVYSPRPGFPQRVVTTPSPSEKESPDAESICHNKNNSSSPTTNTSTFDYLYEFSETRKVLEEFFKCPPPEEETRLETEFQDLEYELRRQANESGSSYVGKRLAKGRCVEPEYSISVESPKKCVTNVDLPSLHGHDIMEHENNFLDLSIGTGSSGDLGETEVGLQVGHSRNFTLSPETTDCDSNCGDLDSEVSLMLMENDLGPTGGIIGSNTDVVTPNDALRLYSSMPVLEDGLSSGHASDTDNNNPTVILMKKQITEIEKEINQGISSSKSANKLNENGLSSVNEGINTSTADINSCIGSFEEPLNLSQTESIDKTPPPPAPAPHRIIGNEKTTDVEAAIKDIRLTLQRTPLQRHSDGNYCEESGGSPVWVPRQRGLSTASGDSDRKGNSGGEEEENDTDLETDRLLGQKRTDDQGFFDDKEKENKKKGRNKEDVIQRSVLIEGVLFRARYLGSTQLVCEGQPTKTTRMMQAEEAVSRIKAPEGESQPSTEVDLFISTEKIMVLNTDLKEIMMDHALRTISYIADIGDLVVLMARRRFVPHEMEDAPKINRTPKMICYVFESEEAQFIAQSIGQAFQVAYMEFLKANGIEDHSFVKELDYQEVLNSQEIFGDELQMFAKKGMQKEVVVPKAKGEILGVVIVESGWGSMLPTVVIANLAPAGAAARCGQLNIGDQIIAINGVSLVGLPLSTCQNYIKNSKNQTVVKLTVVPCAPVVEVKIKRPDTKYQLGFSVQNGVICSLLRGGIAERGGVRVGHRIIEINNQSVVAVPHEKIVNLLATSVGEILMKTMPTSMFRLLTGQESPVYI
ncbi:amyloid-beta A4 precursor protein-binding family A member 2-like [Cylas formicarius]|uniref:amyloid-beta A4 precursor protein-binding family A member 2-like n=1 Tax=Cylas formicarius TaxID=197179 RepID=UPI0029586B2E|nr:amyloid-beta A4 precursor protein-binding family A member 2-like [Cylas formicarius]